jgi:8-oxo-dGTP pyrophosphatase MutT (NUDIX family)
LTETSRPRREAVLCFIRHGDALLLIEGSDSKEWAGRLDAPGGGIEPGETIIDAAVRELREETGLHLAPSALQLKGILYSENFYGRDVLIHIVAGQAPHRNVQSSHEGRLLWVPIDRIDDHRNALLDLGRLVQALLALGPGESVHARSIYAGNGDLVDMDVEIVKD